MTGSSTELGDIIRQDGDAYLERPRHRLPWHQLRVLLDIARCRTSAMGGRVMVCPNCGLLRCEY